MRFMLPRAGFGWQVFSALMWFMMGCGEQCPEVQRLLEQAEERGVAPNAVALARAQAECNSLTVYTEGDENVGQQPYLDKKSTFFSWTGVGTPAPDPNMGVVVTTTDYYPNGVQAAYCVVISDGENEPSQFSAFYKTPVFQANFWRHYYWGGWSSVVEATVPGIQRTLDGVTADWYEVTIKGFSNEDSWWWVEPVTYVVDGGILATGVVELVQLYNTYPFIFVEDVNETQSWVDGWTSPDGGEPRIYAVNSADDCLPLVTQYDE